jgi:hypothetical protein
VKVRSSNPREGYLYWLAVRSDTNMASANSLQIRNDGLTEDRSDQMFPLDLVPFKNVTFI